MYIKCKQSKINDLHDKQKEECAFQKCLLSMNLFGAVIKWTCLDTRACICSLAWICDNVFLYLWWKLVYPYQYLLHYFIIKYILQDDGKPLLFLCKLNTK